MMNFLDTYEITGTGTSTPPQPNQPEQSLNEEVSQVIGQLGRFWGGFRKQSQTALESARKDLGEVVGKFTMETRQTSTGESSTSEEIASQSQGEPEAGPSSGGDKTPKPDDQKLPTSSSQSLFTRLSSSLPPNIVSTVQTHLPDSLKNASQNIDLAQLRTNLFTEFQRVQGVTRAQAEEYVHKSEGMLREAMREAGEVLRDAVKVIPPEEGGPTIPAIWDGTDVWMLPSSSEATITDAKGKGKQVDSGGRLSGEGHRSVATRADALLKQLKYDPAVIRADPEAEEGVKELYLSWISAEIDSKEGGLDNKEWSEKITKALGELGDGEALHETHDTLVPLEMINETFWQRYLFRVYQVEKEEEKRKALLQRSVQNDELFSWEDDEEDPTASSPLAKSARSLNDSTSSDNTLNALSKSGKPAKKTSAPSSQAAESATTSPRLSSEDSYDLVSGNVSTAGDETKVRTRKGEDDDPDSDWE